VRRGIETAKSKISDHGIDCDIAGRNGFFAPFAYQA
jgi:hypothetical protein